MTPRVPQSRSETIRLAIRVQPGAAKNEVTGYHGDALKVRLRARAQEGAANDALLRFLAELFRLPRSAIEILHGHASRDKLIAIHTQDPERVLETLQRLLPESQPLRVAPAARPPKP